MSVWAYRKAPKAEANRVTPGSAGTEIFQKTEQLPQCAEPATAARHSLKRERLKSTAGFVLFTLFGIPIITGGMIVAIDSTEYAKELGATIQGIREEKGIGLRELARLSEISPSYLCEIESGLNVPSVDKVQRLAKALKIPLSRLLPAS